jgi:hypothetical protein
VHEESFVTRTARTVVGSVALVYLAFSADLRIYASLTSPKNAGILVEHG